MPDLKPIVIELLKQKPGLKTTEIADQLRVDRSLINSVLYEKPSGLFVKDRNYRWYLATDIKHKTETIKEFVPTELTLLCNYYLSCLGFDYEDGPSVPTVNEKHDQPYYELDQFIDINVDVVLSTAEGQRIVSLLKKQNRPNILYLGYPCYLRSAYSDKKSGTGFLLEPVLYLPITYTGKEKRYWVDSQAPIINSKALKSITSLDPESIAQEINDLEEELGFNGEELPDWTDIIYHLAHIRPKWKWKGEMNPKILDLAKPISEIEEPGIYNKAVILLAERSPYTVGLESELSELANIPKEKYENTALGQWLLETITPNNKSSPEDILEVFPMNLEQRQAISKALTEPLTVITGPPGTGKSQVVANLLVNSFWKGRRVLFSSKNNQAVNVVEERVNSLGSNLVLLRTGSDDHREKLARYLANYFDIAPSQTLIQELDLIELKRGKLLARLQDLISEEEHFIGQRNELDKVDLTLEFLREKIEPVKFSDIRSMDLIAARASIDELGLAVDRATRDKQNIFVKIFWPFYVNKRILKLEETIARAQTKLLHSPDKETPISDPQAFLHEWDKVYRVNSEALQDYLAIEGYLQKLSQFQQLRPLETITKERMSLLEQLSDLDRRYWSLYVDSIPSRLNNEQKRKLSELKASIRFMDNGADVKNVKGAWKLRAKYHKLLLDLSELFPCWAVTALSARNRIPLEPGYFDLLVIDEASQCDIASALPLLYRAKSAVIIGDDKQLRHISNLSNQQDLKLFEKFNTDYEKIFWTYSENSLFDLAKAINNMETVTLKDHHRSHNDIIEFSNRHFYYSSLRVATKMDRLVTDNLDEIGLRWIDTKGRAERHANGGAFNKAEAKEVIKQLERLTIRNGYLGSIGVVTPFRAQANLIKEMLSKNGTMNIYLNKNQILVDSIHRYQGEERDIMIFSPVLSNNMPPGGLRFLKKNPNLFNVAITRARTLMLVVGDLSACLNSDVEYLQKFAIYSNELHTPEVNKLNDRCDAITNDYPVFIDRSTVSDWEVYLYKAMRERNIQTIPQYTVDQFRLDFALVDGDRRLNIEVDGEHYHKDWNGELCRRDQLRNQRMFELGWDVMRFWVYEIRDDLEGVLNRIENWLKMPNIKDSKE